jgi:hypothetical protein
MNMLNYYYFVPNNNARNKSERLTSCLLITLTLSYLQYIILVIQQ